MNQRQNTPGQGQYQGPEHQQTQQGQYGQGQYGQ